jgi:hypothetical protein
MSDKDFGITVCTGVQIASLIPQNDKPHVVTRRVDSFELLSRDKSICGESSNGRK